MAYSNSMLSGLDLDKGEQVLWTGKPILWLRMYDEEANLVMYGLTMLIVAYLLAKDAAIWSHPLAKCEIALGVLLGLYLVVGRMLVDVLVRSRTHYVITSRRVVFLRSRPWRTVSIEHDSIEKLELALYDSDSGTIAFCRAGDQPLWWTLLQSNRTKAPNPKQPRYRLMIHDVRHVYDLLRLGSARYPNGPLAGPVPAVALTHAADGNPFLAGFAQRMRQGAGSVYVGSADRCATVDDRAHVQVIGVYSIPLTFDVYLVELVVDLPASRVDVSGFTQEVPGRPRADWQAPWQERYLDAAGERVTGDGAHPPAEEVSTRLAFFLHFLDLERPLLTPWGPVDLPHSSALPARLAGIITYQAPD